MPTVLVTGGAGYIGSHACVALADAGYDVVCVDNLSNSSRIAIDRVREITGKDVAFHEIDLTERQSLAGVFDAHHISSVMHFAALKAVGESVEQPLRYYRNNLTASLNLLAEMSERGIKDLIFSSSATVYGDPESVPIPETAKLGPTNPYGQTKLFTEQMCRDVANAENGWRIALLRYFNPIGAHQSGRIGEDPIGIPNNLLPYVLQVAVGRREHLNVFGDDYPTPDGTGVRDYIHVMDLVEGHVAALDAIDKLQGCVAINLGTGRGYSVLEVVKAVEAAVGKPIPYEIAPRRAGDVAEMYADPALARDTLGWEAKRGLADACEDAWRWQSQNPSGF